MPATTSTGSGVAGGSESSSLRILVSGSSGLVGSRLCRDLSRVGHQVGRLVRRTPDRSGDIQWDPQAGRLEAGALAHFDAFVHLSGESIASGKWTEDVKRRIRESRIGSTRLLADSIARLPPGPRVLIVASAIGYYGDRGDETLTEQSAAGRSFLAEICREWEAAADSARAAGVRVVNPRIGVVLSAAGGALAKMLTPFRLGLGGVVGSGRQWMSWIAIGDLTRLIAFVLDHDSLTGPINAVSPEPVTNYEFTKTLGALLKRPTIMPIPAMILRLTLGQMAEETVLCSARVLPRRLIEAGFRFDCPFVRDALNREIGQS